MAEKGIFSLRTANDLFGKLEHDLNRIREDPADSYAAFDFFVTAFHMYDWKGLDLKGKKAFTAALSQPDRTIWEICRQLANGSKHFEVFDTYSSVKKTKMARGAFQVDAFQLKGFQSRYLKIRLEAESAAELKADSIRVDTLAEKLVEFWRRRL